MVLLLVMVQLYYLDQTQSIFICFYRRYLDHSHVPPGNGAAILFQINNNCFFTNNWTPYTNSATYLLVMELLRVMVPLFYVHQYEVCFSIQQDNIYTFRYLPAGNGAAPRNGAAV